MGRVIHSISIVFYSFNRSFVGKRNRGQKVNLSLGCNVLGTVLHELMHLLGFVHEHASPDRDEYVLLNKDNIVKGNFCIHVGF